MSKREAELELVVEDLMQALNALTIKTDGEASKSVQHKANLTLGMAAHFMGVAKEYGYDNHAVCYSPERIVSYAALRFGTRLPTMLRVKHLLENKKSHAGNSTDRVLEEMGL